MNEDESLRLGDSERRWKLQRGLGFGNQWRRFLSPDQICVDRSQPTLYNLRYLYATLPPKKRPIWSDRSPKKNSCWKSWRGLCVRTLQEQTSSCHRRLLCSGSQRNYTDWSRSLESTVAQIHPIIAAPRKSTFVHHHPKGHTNEIMAASESRSAQLAAYRAFLDAFYRERGFVPWYQRPKYVRGISSDVMSRIPKTIWLRPIPNCSRNSDCFCSQISADRWSKDKQSGDRTYW